MPNLEKILHFFLPHFGASWMTEPLLNRPKKYKSEQSFQISSKVSTKHYSIECFLISLGSEVRHIYIYTHTKFFKNQDPSRIWTRSENHSSPGCMRNWHVVEPDTILQHYKELLKTNCLFLEVLTVWWFVPPTSGDATYWNNGLRLFFIIYTLIKRYSTA